MSQKTTKQHLIESIFKIGVTVGSILLGAYLLNTIGIKSDGTIIEVPQNDSLQLPDINPIQEPAKDSGKTIEKIKTKKRCEKSFTGTIISSTIHDMSKVYLVCLNCSCFEKVYLEKNGNFVFPYSPKNYSQNSQISLELYLDYSLIDDFLIPSSQKRVRIELD